MDMPEPLIPAHIDLTNFEFMPLDVQRLLGSDKWIEAADHPYLGHAMMSLWAASWHEVPAGSLPNKARVLARHAHRTLEQFEGIAQMVMAGWVLCSDNRFYHPVVCEKALEAWDQKQKFKARTARATAAKIAGAKGAKPSPERNEDRDDHRDDDRDGERNEGEQTGPGPDLEQTNTTPDAPKPELVLNPVEALEKKKKKRRAARARLSVSGEADFSPGFEAFWLAYPKKVGKQVAWQKWCDDQLDEFTTTLVRDVTERQKRHDQWLRGYVPDPATYLNQRRWTDEIIGPKPADAPVQRGPVHNPAGTSPKKAETPQTKLEAAEYFAASQADLSGWTPQQVADYLAPFQEAARGAS